MKLPQLVGSSIIIGIFGLAGIFGYQKLQKMERELTAVREQLNARTAMRPLPQKPAEKQGQIVAGTSADGLDELRHRLKGLIADHSQLSTTAGADAVTRDREQWKGLPVFLPSELGKEGVRPKVIPQSQRVPVYPAKQRKEKVNGSVDLSFIVGVDGKSHEIKVIKSSDLAFEAAAIDAVSGWAFTPGAREGAHVNTRITLPVKFVIGPESPPNPRWF